MEKNKWLKLKSGSDIRGTAIRDKNESVDLTKKVAETIGKSFADWLAENKVKENNDLTIAVGKDSRISGDKLKKNLIKGLTGSGVNVYDCGLASTPAMFMSTIFDEHNYDGAIMITASHHPYNKNGFKFFTEKGGLEEENITKILEMAATKDLSYIEEKENRKVFRIDLIKDYSRYIIQKIKYLVDQDVNKSKPLSGFNIVVDAGNGTGGFFVDEILKPLGADTSGSQFLKPDGRFPNHVPNPENDEAMQAIKQAVNENDADLGIIFDTDVDRAAVVDGKGRAINRNRLIALASVIVLNEHPGSIIVTDSVTSKGLTNFIEDKLGGHHHRFKRGYKNVINEAIRLNKEGKEAHLAIETSGHAAFKENYFLDDGAYLIAKILVKMANLKKEGQNIGELISDLKEPEIAKEYRMTIQLDEFKDYGKNVLEQLKSFVKKKSNWEIAPKNYEGVRVNYGEDDWFLMRMSLHDPVLVLNVECDRKENLKDIKKNLKNFLEEFDNLNIEELL